MALSERTTSVCLPLEIRLVKVEKGTARRTGYVQAAVEAASERTKEIERTRLAAEDAR